MIVSVHLADLGKRRGLRFLRQSSRTRATPGLRYAALTTAAPLSDRVLAKLQLTSRVGLIAAWEDDSALAEQLRDGWRVRLAPTHIFGAWPQMDGLVDEQTPMADDEAAAVLTIGRLRLSQTRRFMRASAAAERLALRSPAMLAATALVRPPTLVATFSLWRSTREMRAYASGGDGPEHVVASRAHAAKPFHHESAFIRFRPYDAQGSWQGVDGSFSAAGQEVAAKTA
ncbi:MAG TPA: hypothetical protein VGO29_06080 [Solirubrobacteraceae bacterium]|nr:hypothetical protein [Solirubrobacteraceae bacterium]